MWPTIPMPFVSVHHLIRDKKRLPWRFLGQKKWQDTIFTINGSSLSPLTPKEQVIRGSNGGQISSFVWFQCILAWESGEVNWRNTKHHLFFLLTYIWQTSFGQNYMALVAAILENISISCIFSFTKSSLWSKFYHKSFYLHFVYTEILFKIHRYYPTCLLEP